MLIQNSVQAIADFKAIGLSLRCAQMSKHRANKAKTPKMTIVSVSRPMWVLCAGSIAGAHAGIEAVLCVISSRCVSENAAPLSWLKEVAVALHCIA